MAALVLAVGLAVVGCDTAPEASPSPAPTPASSMALPTGAAGSDGLTVRYRDDAGRLQTLHVEDFPR
jgi:hypothetical protein